MSRGQNHGRPFDKRVAAPHAPDTAVADFKIRNAATEHELAARAKDRLPDILHDARQLVGSDMRMGFIEDFGRGAMEHQRLQRLVVIAALLATREKLAVRESPRAALAESVVRIGIDCPVAVDLRNVDLARRNVTAPLQDNGLQPQLDQPQRREKPSRARSHDYDLGMSRDIGIIEMHGCGLRLPVDIDLQRQVDLRLPLPGIDRAFDDPHQGNIVLRHPQTPRGKRSVILRVGSLTGR